MQTAQNPLILTLRLDDNSQAFFDALRERHFPPDRNFLKAHLTLFHKLPDQPDTLEYFRNLQYDAFEMKVIGLRHLGTGVAYQLESPELQQLRKEASVYFWPVLSPQDHQAFKPHITIQNKVTPEASKALITELNAHFKPFTVNGIGLDLWEYLGGPWRHNFSCDFIKINNELDLPEL